MRDEPKIGSLEPYLGEGHWGWTGEYPPLPYEAVAWRKMRNGRRIGWTYYGRYSWANIRKWVMKRGDVYQIATASGQICTIRRARTPRWLVEMDAAIITACREPTP